MDGRLVLAVVTLVTLAGCGVAPLGGGSADTPDETLTPVPVPATETPAKTSGESPPGVTEDGVDPERLRRAHEAFLEGRSYEWELTYNQSGTLLQRSEFTRRAVVVGDRFFVEQEDCTSPVTESLFVDDSGGYLRVVEHNKTRTETLQSPGDTRDYVPTGQLVERHLGGANPNVSTVERDGETYYRIHVTTPTPSARALADVTEYRVTAYVTPAGFVTSMTVRYDRPRGDSLKTVSFRYNYHGLDGTTLSEPNWVGRINTTDASTPRPDSGPTASPTAS
jgi:hypothetical protein